MKTTEQGKPVLVHDRYGWAVVFADGFRSAMPNEKTAKRCAAAPAMLGALEAALPFLKQYIEEAGPCDHSVNTCVCDLIGKAEQVNAALRLAKGE